MSDQTALLLAVHLAATMAMFGVIWFVQVVHYPLFAAVGRPEFAEYEAQHVRRTGWVVGPLMAIEVLAAIAILFFARDEVGLALPLVGLALLLAIHACTAFFAVPAHRRLEEGFDDATQRRLVATNWLRTAGWTARSGIAVAMVVVA
jgi:hypothetical protein